jgi:hypothetical protein
VLADTLADEHRQGDWKRDGPFPGGVIVERFVIHDQNSGGRHHRGTSGG